jgi:PKHD-type hydroxylase
MIFMENIIASPSIFYPTRIDDELFDLILKKVNQLSVEQDALIDHNDAIDANIRKSKVRWWGSNHWVTSIFSHYFNLANVNNWEYDLSYLSEIQITKYTAGGFYTWHCDYGVRDDAYKNTRKLSASLLVSNPNNFVGGDLEFIGYDGKKITAPREMGCMTIFDSRLPHRVTQLTSGERISLVAWMCGPKLK